MIDNMLLTTIKDVLSSQEISWIIRDSFKKSELKEIYKSLFSADNQDFLKNYSHEDMVRELTNEIINKTDRGLSVLSELEKNNLSVMQEIQSLDVSSIRARLSRLISSAREEKIGIYLWALLTDNRRDIFGLHRMLINQYKAANRSGGDSSGPHDFRDSSGGPSQGRNRYDTPWNARHHYQSSGGGRNLLSREPRSHSKYRRPEERNRDQDYVRICVENEDLKTKLGQVQKELIEKKSQEAKTPSPYMESLAQQFLSFQDHLNGLEDKILLQNKSVLAKLDTIVEELKVNRHEIKIQRSDIPRQVRGKDSRVGVFVDAQNMFYAAKNQYNARLDYAKLLEAGVNFRRLIKAVVYLVQTPEVDQSSFVAMLQHKNYEVRTKDLRLRLDGSAKGDWDMGMAIDVISLCDQLDVVVIVSGDGDFVSLVNLIKSRGPRVEVYGFPHNTSVDLKEAADEFYPIAEAMLLDYPTNYSYENRSFSRNSSYTPTRKIEPSELDFSDSEEEEEGGGRRIDISMFEKSSAFQSRSR